MATIMDKGYWISFLNSLHNITRNGKSKYTGMDALNEIVNLLTIKFIEHRKIELKLDDDMLFTNIFNNYCTPKHITDDSKKKSLKRIKNIFFKHFVEVFYT